MATESNFLGLRIKDPVWYLVIYPLVFASIFGFLKIVQDSIEIGDTLAAILAIVFGGIITLLLRSESIK